MFKHFLCVSLSCLSLLGGTLYAKRPTQTNDSAPGHEVVFYETTKRNNTEISLLVYDLGEYYDIRCSTMWNSNSSFSGKNLQDGFAEDMMWLEFGDSTLYIVSENVSVTYYNGKETPSVSKNGTPNGMQYYVFDKYKNHNLKSAYAQMIVKKPEQEQGERTYVVYGYRHIYRGEKKGWYLLDKKGEGNASEIVYGYPQLSWDIGLRCSELVL